MSTSTPLQPSIKLVRVIVGLVILQFLLGVLASLYSEIPADNPAEVFHQFGFISAHVVNGTLLLVLGAVFVYQAVTRKKYKREAMSGLGAMIGAYVFGELFVFTQNDLMSFLMAGSFIGALLPYAKVMYTASVKAR